VDPKDFVGTRNIGADGIKKNQKSLLEGERKGLEMNLNLKIGTWKVN